MPGSRKRLPAAFYRGPVGGEPVRDWLKSLVNDLGMKIMMGPIAGYSPVEGNRGLTAAVVIETSHIVLHVWDEEQPAMMQLDVYTCGELNPDVIWAGTNDGAVHVTQDRGKTWRAVAIPGMPERLRCNA